MSKAEKERQKIETILAEEDKKVPVNPRQQLLSSLSNGDSSDFKKLFEENLKLEQIKVGEIVKGTIVGIQTDFVMVDVGYKSEGMILLEDFKFAGNEEKVELGQKVDVYVESMENENGMVVLSKNRADMMRAWNDICRAAENEEEIQGKVIAKVKGGLSVDIGVKAFLPGSQIDIRPTRNMDSYVGNIYKFKVIKFNKKRGNIVLSRRVLLEKEREELRHKMEGSLKEGSEVKGFVKNLTDYGAFIDLGSMDGLLHITDMSWGRLQHPSDMLKIGDEITVKILKYSEEKQRASLGLKQLTPDPWVAFKENYSTKPPNNKVKGKITNLTDYGAFISLGKGVEGLIHISELSWGKKIKHPSEVLSLGDELEVILLEINEEKHRLSLSLKQMEENPWTKLEHEFPVGKVLEGTIKSITDFGIFVDVGADSNGLVRTSDISWSKKAEDPKQIFKEGQNIKVKILSVNIDQGKFSLGIKQLETDPWEKVDETYPIGSQHEVKAQKIVDFGVFVQLDEATSMEGLIHISELSLPKNKKVSDIIEEGQMLAAEVISIDKNARKIGLSTNLRLERTPNDIGRGAAAAKKEKGESPKQGSFRNLFGEGLKKLTEKRDEEKSESES